ncbi:BTAD domain-containing putative transcriptional regulator [Curtobacterium sp. MCPF17_031]|uniref:AfsR/SARP family transcriptional regulator n=1 Tax=Curtobacterium sp. MCPF17_031 TaxID=2175653 RepID=UPI000DA98462|nr:BTAD domain-containing putative transcriptional regulator [Curtobacterium sp. MCPF17_031]PZE34236.1 SARP family transcriptional regulator [Curtobacterium sp. MCPF17_031]
MKVNVLGPVSVEIDGVAIPIGSTRVRAVLAVLALNAGRTVSAAHLVDEIWGAGELRNARNALQAAVARLRRALAPSGTRSARPVLYTEPSGYRLAVDPNQVDALRFRRVASTSRDRFADDPAGALGHFDEALRLWRGPALEGVSGGDLLQSERQRLDETRAELYELRAYARLATGQTFGSAAELRRLVGIYPHRERLHELLMIALHDGGQQSEALTVYRDVRRHLTHEFGIEPSERLQNLHDAILAQRELAHPGSVIFGGQRDVSDASTRRQRFGSAAS